MDGEQHKSCSWKEIGVDKRIVRGGESTCRAVTLSVRMQAGGRHTGH